MENAIEALFVVVVLVTMAGTASLWSVWAR
jgi:hypothetical protein